MKNCSAYQASDQMICGPCTLQWDMNDEDPPKCQHRVVKGLAKKVEKLQPVPVPVVQETIAVNLPLRISAEQAFEMARVYEAQRAFGQNMTQAMQKAHAAFVASI